MTTQDEIISRIAKDMADEIDWEILADIYLKNGWTEVILKDHWRYNLIEVDRWNKANCKGPATGYKNRWLFREAADATWFTLRWSK
jgi:hypothetical protein